ncbi:33028_t:CDS:2, partial [Gigaspora margarita]
PKEQQQEPTTQPKEQQQEPKPAQEQPKFEIKKILEVLGITEGEIGSESYWRGVLGNNVTIQSIKSVEETQKRKGGAHLRTLSTSESLGTGKFTSDEKVKKAREELESLKQEEILERLTGKEDNEGEKFLIEKVKTLFSDSSDESRELGKIIAHSILTESSAINYCSAKKAQIENTLSEPKTPYGANINFVLENENARLERELDEAKEKLEKFPKDAYNALKVSLSGELDNARTKEDTADLVKKRIEEGNESIQTTLKDIISLIKNNFPETESFKKAASENNELLAHLKAIEKNCQTAEEGKKNQKDSTVDTSTVDTSTVDTSTVDTSKISHNLIEENKRLKKDKRFLNSLVVGVLIFSSFILILAVFLGFSNPKKKDDEEVEQKKKKTSAAKAAVCKTAISSVQVRPVPPIALVAQGTRAFDFGSKGRGFKSYQACQKNELKKWMEVKIIARAKKKLRDYRIIKEFISGLVLSGQEIKSLRNYQSSIDEAYVMPQNGEVYVINMNINPYKYSRGDNSSAKLKVALAQHLRKYQIKDRVKEKEIKRKITTKDF